MEIELLLPSEVPVMTLPSTAFFPQALLPLHIFEPRYRRMLADALATDRLFAVAGIDDQQLALLAQDEPPCAVATVGMVRACKENPDKTSHLLLHGISRVRITGIVQEKPYRIVSIEPLTSEPGATDDTNGELRNTLRLLIRQEQALGAAISPEFTQFLDTVDDPETFADLAAFNLCDQPALKQRLLETLNTNRRLELLLAQTRDRITQLRLQRDLQGDLADDDISNN